MLPVAMIPGVLLILTSFLLDLANVQALPHCRGAPLMLSPAENAFYVAYRLSAQRAPTVNCTKMLAQTRLEIRDPYGIHDHEI